MKVIAVGGDDERLVVSGEAFFGDVLLQQGDYQEALSVRHPDCIETDVGALLFLRGREHDLNIRGAFLHMAADALVSLGFLVREEGVYRNAPDAECYLDKAKPSYIGGILEMANHRLYPFWGGLTAALRTGEASSATGSLSRRRTMSRSLRMPATLPLASTFTTMTL